MPGVDLRTELLHIVKLNWSWVFFFCFPFPTVSVLCWIHWVAVEHVSYILIHSIKTFICVIKIQVSKKMDSVDSWPAYLAEAVFEGKKDKEIISLHEWFGDRFAKPFLVHHVKLYPKCILFGNRKSFFFCCERIQWKMHKSTSIWMTSVICIHLFKERCLWRLLFLHKNYTQHISGSFVH